MLLMLGTAPKSLAEETPAETIKAVLAGFSKGDIAPLITRVSGIDKELFSGFRSGSRLEYIKAGLKLPPETTAGWGEYEFGIANDYVREWGVVVNKKNPELERAYQQAYISDQWVRGNYAEVDLYFPLNAFKYSPHLIRFVLFRENGKWKISHYSSMFMTASMLISPMSNLNPLIIGDYADFCLSYVYGDRFKKIQTGTPKLTRFSGFNRLKKMYSAVTAKAANYIANGGAAAKSGRREQIYDGNGNPVGEMKHVLSHERSRKNPYLSLPLDDQLRILRNPFLLTGQAYANFAVIHKSDQAAASKALGLAGEAYARSENYLKAAETYESVARGNDQVEQTKAKKALVDIYLNRLHLPQKAEPHQRDLEASGQVPEYERMTVAAPETLLVRSAPETRRLTDFELGPDNETLYLLYRQSHGNDTPPWVETSVVEYRGNGSSKTISSVRSENIDATSFYYFGKGEDGLWVFGNGGHGYKIDYSGNFQKYFTDARNYLKYTAPDEKLPKYPNMRWEGMTSASGMVYGMGSYEIPVIPPKKFKGLRIFDEATGKGKAGFIGEKQHQLVDIRKRAEIIAITSEEDEEILVYDLKRMRREYLKGDPPATSLSAAEALCADAEGNLYVALSDHKVFLFSKEGKKLSEFATGDILPLHIGVDGKHRIFLAGPIGDGKAAGIRIFSTAGKERGRFDFETPPNGAGRFFVRNLRVTDKGTVFVNVGNTEIRRYNDRGKELDRWGRKLNGNLFLATDNQEDSLYIFDGRNVYHYKGAATVKLPEPRLSSIYKAEMSGDADGVIHGYDLSSGIFSFNPKTGRPVFRRGNENNMSLGSNKMLVDTQDNLWVINGPVLQKYSPDGKELVNIKIGGRKARRPVSIDYDTRGNFVVADNANMRIVRYSPGGKIVSDIDVSRFTKGISKIRIDKNNNLYLLRTDFWGGKEEILYRFNKVFAAEN